jgi:hypothetical protein
MQIIVKCGNDDCRSEFKANVKDPEWICPQCDRVIPNKNYPFLTAKLMQARSKPEDANWERLHDDLLEKAAEIIKEKDAEIEELKKRLNISEEED